MSVSAFFAAQRPRLLGTRSIGPVIDLACGRGRHALACAEAGLVSLALDRNPDHLREIQQTLRENPLGKFPGALCCVRADLEAEAEIPIRTGSCGAVLVFRFLSRRRAPAIAELLAPGGLLLYETFTLEQRALGFGPSREAFLLAPGELPSLFPELEILSFEEGLTNEPRPCHTARLLARKPNAPTR